MSEGSERTVAHFHHSVATPRRPPSGEVPGDGLEHFEQDCTFVVSVWGRNRQANRLSTDRTNSETKRAKHRDREAEEYKDEGRQTETETENETETDSKAKHRARNR